MYDDPIPPWDAWYNQSSFLHSIYVLSQVIFYSIIVYYLGRAFLRKQEEKSKDDPSFKWPKVHETTFRCITWIGAIGVFIYIQFFTPIRYDDGIYCARVKYFNPNTGTTTRYRVSVEVENNRLTTIYFPSGGWLDGSHFDPPIFNQSGVATIIDDRNYEYQVSNLKEGDCQD